MKIRDWFLVMTSFVIGWACGEYADLIRTLLEEWLLGVYTVCV
jgi:hypothetical protein